MEEVSFKRLFLIILLMLGTYDASLFSYERMTDGCITSCQFSSINQFQQNYLLKLSSNEEIFNRACNKVENLVISGPFFSNSGVKCINNYNAQQISYSRRKCSLIAHHEIFLSETLIKSSLINILRI